MKGIQYTVRNIPAGLDRQLKSEAKERGLSLNQFVLDTLAQAVGREGASRRFNDLDALAGGWKEDPSFDAAVAEFRTVDEGAWK